MPNIETMSQRMSEARQTQGLSFVELAEQTGLSVSSLQRYERGEVENIPLHKVELLATALKTTPAFLMGWENPNGETREHAVGEICEALTRLSYKKLRLILLFVRSLSEAE